MLIPPHIISLFIIIIFLLSLWHYIRKMIYYIINNYSIGTKISTLNPNRSANSAWTPLQFHLGAKISPHNAISLSINWTQVPDKNDNDAFSCIRYLIMHSFFSSWWARPKFTTERPNDKFIIGPYKAYGVCRSFLGIN